AVKALREAVHLQALRIYIPNLLQDDSLRVRCAVIEMIAATHLEEYYPALLGGLYYKSTRNAAMQALVKLENEALPMLVELATNIYKPEIVRIYAWRTISQIPSLEAIDTLWQFLETSRGNSRDHILRALLKRLQKEGILGSVEQFYQTKVKTLIEQELYFIGELYAAYIDFENQLEIYNQ
ncbi:MFS transporter, partial [Fischerella thermalis CCMEE 5196]